MSLWGCCKVRAASRLFHHGTTFPAINFKFWIHCFYVFYNRELLLLSFPVRPIRRSRSSLRRLVFIQRQDHFWTFSLLFSLSRLPDSHACEQNTAAAVWPQPEGEPNKRELGPSGRWNQGYSLVLLRREFGQSWKTENLRRGSIYILQYIYRERGGVYHTHLLLLLHRVIIYQMYAPVVY